MQFPSGGDYSQAIQSPNHAFADADLKAAQVHSNSFGLPIPYSGGFTTTFRLKETNGRAWAVRCFTKSIADLEKRYAAISHVTQSSDLFVNTSYLKTGIRVAGKWYPIIKMEWVDGQLLNRYIEQCLSTSRSSELLENLKRQFIALVDQLDHMGIAHGDLQHGNIVVSNNALKLIDYDGLYVPQLAHLSTNEIGHPNFQHPLRDETHYGASIDRFSAIAIVLALSALAHRPTLWRTFDNGDNILFRSADFLQPDQSRVLIELSNIPQMEAQVDIFKRICQADFDAIPQLSSFLSGNVGALGRSVKRVTQRTPYPILNATNPDQLRRYVGQKVVVIGYINQHRKSFTKYGDPYIFLNFGKYPEHTFTLVFWADTLRLFEQRRIKPEQYEGCWASVTGVVSEYDGRPQMAIAHPSEIEIISEEDARQRLNVRLLSQPQVKRTLPTPMDLQGEYPRVFTSLYGAPKPAAPLKKYATPPPMPSGGSKTPSLGNSTVFPTPRNTPPPVPRRRVPASSYSVPISSRYWWIMRARTKRDAMRSTVRAAITSLRNAASLWHPYPHISRLLRGPSRALYTTVDSYRRVILLALISLAVLVFMLMGFFVIIAIMTGSSSTDNHMSLSASPSGMGEIQETLDKSRTSSTPIPVIIPQPSATSSVTPTNTPTLKPSPIQPTAPVPTSTLTPSKTVTPSPTATQTVSPTSTLTPLPTRTAAPSPTRSPVAYVMNATQRVNLRACPRLDCRIVGGLRPREVVYVVRTVRGDNYEGSTEWHQILYQDTYAYFHSSFAVLQP